MIQTIREHTTVKTNGIIEIRHPSLTTGTVADVIVLVERNETTSPARSLTSFLGSCRGVYGTSESIDNHLNELRDEWGP